MGIVNVVFDAVAVADGEANLASEEDRRIGNYDNGNQLPRDRNRRFLDHNLAKHPHFRNDDPRGCVPRPHSCQGAILA